MCVRLWSIELAGGLGARFLYDDGVYFSAAIALVNGREPYSEFVFLHPPGSMLVYAPFAELARGSVTDPQAFAFGRLAVVLLGGVNAVLVYFAGRRVGLAAGASAAILYAVWQPAVFVERSTLLEPLVLFGSLLAAALLFGREGAGAVAPWRAYAAGAGLGLAVATKLWAVVPAAVFVVWLVSERRWPDTRRLVLGASGVLVAVVALFAARAPGQMWELVISAQSGRNRDANSVIERAGQFLGLGGGGALAWLAVASLAIGSLWLWSVEPKARLWVAWLAVSASVLLVVPTYFTGYSSFVAPSLALVLGALVSRLRKPVLVASTTGALAVACLVAVWARPYAAGPVPADAVNAMSASRCLATDHPALAVLADKSTSTMSQGCPAVVDPTGVAIWLAHGGARRDSVAYQQWLRDYFAASDAVVIARPGKTAMSQETTQQVRRRPVLHRDIAGLVVRGAEP